MAKDRMARAMAETLINKVIRDLKNDPERGLRNIIDLMLMMPREKFSENLFVIIRRILSDENSAYYTLVKNVAADVDAENLKKFIFNVGFNCCTNGKKIIRKKSKELGFPVPWSIGIGSEYLKKYPDAVSKMVSEGKELGIYLYLIAGSECMEDSITEVYRDNPDCAFVLFMDAKDVKEINKLDGINNLLISVSGENRAALTEAVDTLHKYQRFFACHRYYNDENIAKLISDPELESASDFTNSFVFYIPDKKSSMTGCLSIKENLRRIRDSQKYAFIPIDIKGDISEIDNTIYEGSFSVFFKDDGRSLTSQGKRCDHSYDISKLHLTDIFKDLYMSLN